MLRDEILAKLRERIVGFAASHLSRDFADDIAQEVMLVLHTKYNHLDRVEDVLPLSLRIARFKITAAHRKAHRRGEDRQISVEDAVLADPGMNPGQSAERKEMLDRLSSALQDLETRCRELFRLKLEGKSFPEIQGTMGVRSINTIYTWDSRCRKRLLERLGGSWGGRP